MICEFDCVVCGAHVRKQRSPANTKTTPQFCSHICQGLARRGIGNGITPNHHLICEQCGSESDVYRSPTAQVPRFCSLRCLGESQRGEHNPAFTGGRHMLANGYMVVLAPDDPEADSRGYIYEHRLVARSIVGRMLTPREVVHHIDKNKVNNVPGNLRVFQSQSAHLRHHREMNANG